jgi:hypothetical protein
MEKSSIEADRPDSWTLVRDAAALQVKLLADGLRDLVLVPASLVAAVLSLLSTQDGKPGPQFYRLLRLGKRSERWIDLFAAYRRFPDDVDEQAEEYGADINMDDILDRMETFIVDEYQKGDVSRQAKVGIDKALTAMKQRRRSRD